MQDRTEGENPAWENVSNHRPLRDSHSRNSPKSKASRGDRPKKFTGSVPTIPLARNAHQNSTHLNECFIEEPYGDCPDVCKKANSTQSDEQLSRAQKDVQCPLTQKPVDRKSRKRRNRGRRRRPPSYRDCPPRSGSVRDQGGSSRERLTKKGTPTQSSNRALDGGRKHPLFREEAPSKPFSAESDGKEVPHEGARGDKVQTGNPSSNEGLASDGLSNGAGFPSDPDEAHHGKVSTECRPHLQLSSRRARIFKLSIGELVEQAPSHPPTHTDRRSFSSTSSCSEDLFDFIGSRLEAQTEAHTDGNLCRAQHRIPQVQSPNTHETMKNEGQKTISPKDIGMTMPASQSPLEKRHKEVTQMMEKKVSTESDIPHCESALVNEEKSTSVKDATPQKTDSNASCLPKNRTVARKIPEHLPSQSIPKENTIRVKQPHTRTSRPRGSVSAETKTMGNREVSQTEIKSTTFGSRRKMIPAEVLHQNKKTSAMKSPQCSPPSSFLTERKTKAINEVPKNVASSNRSHAELTRDDELPHKMPIPCSPLNEIPEKKTALGSCTEEKYVSSKGYPPEKPAFSSSRRSFLNDSAASVIENPQDKCSDVKVILSKSTSESASRKKGDNSLKGPGRKESAVSPPEVNPQKAPPSKSSNIKDSANVKKFNPPCKETVAQSNPLNEALTDHQITKPVPAKSRDAKLSTTNKTQRNIKMVHEFCWKGDEKNASETNTGKMVRDYPIKITVPEGLVSCEPQPSGTDRCQPSQGARPSSTNQGAQETTTWKTEKCPIDPKAATGKSLGIEMQERSTGKPLGNDTPGRSTAGSRRKTAEGKLSKETQGNICDPDPYVAVHASVLKKNCKERQQRKHDNYNEPSPVRRGMIALCKDITTQDPPCPKTEKALEGKVEGKVDATHGEKRLISDTKNVWNENWITCAENWDSPPRNIINMLLEFETKHRETSLSNALLSSTPKSDGITTPDIDIRKDISPPVMPSVTVEFGVSSDKQNNMPSLKAGVSPEESVSDDSFLEQACKSKHRPRRLAALKTSPNPNPNLHPHPCQDKPDCSPSLQQSHRAFSPSAELKSGRYWYAEIPQVVTAACDLPHQMALEVVAEKHASVAKDTSSPGSRKKKKKKKKKKRQRTERAPRLSTRWWSGPVSPVETHVDYHSLTTNTSPPPDSPTTPTKPDQYSPDQQSSPNHNPEAISKTCERKRHLAFVATNAAKRRERSPHCSTEMTLRYHKESSTHRQYDTYECYTRYNAHYLPGPRKRECVQEDPFLSEQQDYRYSGEYIETRRKLGEFGHPRRQRSRGTDDFFTQHEQREATQSSFTVPQGRCEELADANDPDFSPDYGNNSQVVAQGRRQQCLEWPHGMMEQRPSIPGINVEQSSESEAEGRFMSPWDVAERPLSRDYKPPTPASVGEGTWEETEVEDPYDYSAEPAPIRPQGRNTTVYGQPGTRMEYSPVPPWPPLLNRPPSTGHRDGQHLVRNLRYRGSRGRLPALRGRPDFACYQEHVHSNIAERQLPPHLAARRARYNRRYNLSRGFSSTRGSPQWPKAESRYRGRPKEDDMRFVHASNRGHSRPNYRGYSRGTRTLWPRQYTGTSQRGFIQDPSDADDSAQNKKFRGQLVDRRFFGDQSKPNITIPRGIMHDNRSQTVSPGRDFTDQSSEYPVSAESGQQNTSEPAHGTVYPGQLQNSLPPTMPDEDVKQKVKPTSPTSTCLSHGALSVAEMGETTDGAEVPYSSNTCAHGSLDEEIDLYARRIGLSPLNSQSADQDTHSESSIEDSGLDFSFIIDAARSLRSPVPSPLPTNAESHFEEAQHQESATDVLSVAAEVSAKAYPGEPKPLPATNGSISSGVSGVDDKDAQSYSLIRITSDTDEEDKTYQDSRVCKEYSRMPATTEESPPQSPGVRDPRVQRSVIIPLEQSWSPALKRQAESIMSSDPTLKLEPSERNDPAPDAEDVTQNVTPNSRGQPQSASSEQIKECSEEPARDDSIRKVLFVEESTNKVDSNNTEMKGEGIASNTDLDLRRFIRESDIGGIENVPIEPLVFETFESCSEEDEDYDCRSADKRVVSLKISKGTATQMDTTTEMEYISIETTHVSTQEEKEEGSFSETEDLKNPTSPEQSDESEPEYDWFDNPPPEGKDIKKKESQHKSYSSNIQQSSKNVKHTSRSLMLIGPMMDRVRALGSAVSTGISGNYADTEPLKKFFPNPLNVLSPTSECSNDSDLESLTPSLLCRQRKTRWSDPVSTESTAHNDVWKQRFKERYGHHQTPFIDTHCHLDFLFKRSNFEGSYEKYRRQNELTFPPCYAGCVAVFCDPRTFQKDGMLKDVLQEPCVWGAVGCHPKSAIYFDAAAERNLMDALSHKKVVALGEIGLDYSGSFKQHEDVQKKVFREQITLAVKINMPLVIHCRDAEEDCVKILTELLPRNHKIHRHCFTGTWDEAQTWLRHFPNSFLGLTPLITFTHGPRQVAREMPLDRLLLETDAPYFVPRMVPRDDMACSHPGMAITVAAEVAQIKGISVEEVLKQCLRNTEGMYGIRPSSA